MHADPLSEPEDAMSSSPPPVPPSTPQIPDTDLFQRTVLLTEAMNRLKQCINEEKLAHHLNPNHLEEDSSNKEETEVPITSIPLALLSQETLGTLLSDMSTVLSTPEGVSPSECHDLISLFYYFPLFSILISSF